MNAVDQILDAIRKDQLRLYEEGHSISLGAFPDLTYAMPFPVYYEVQRSPMTQLRSTLEPVQTVYGIPCEADHTLPDGVIEVRGVPTPQGTYYLRIETGNREQS